MAALHGPTTPVVERSNRVHWFAGRVHEVLDEVTSGGPSVAELTPSETAEALTELWAEDGRTSVRDGRMVCPRHHRMVHQPRFDTEYLQNGKLQITKRRRQ